MSSTVTMILPSMTDDSNLSVASSDRYSVSSQPSSVGLYNSDIENDVFMSSFENEVTASPSNKRKNDSNSTSSTPKKKRYNKPRQRCRSPALVEKLKKTRRVKANDRERGRMHGLNDALDTLREVLPETMTGGDNKLTKIETLRMAYNYIFALSSALEVVESVPGVPVTNNSVNITSNSVMANSDISMGNPMSCNSAIPVCDNGVNATNNCGVLISQLLDTPVSPATMGYQSPHVQAQQHQQPRVPTQYQHQPAHPSEQHHQLHDSPLTTHIRLAPPTNSSSPVPLQFQNVLPQRDSNSYLSPVHPVSRSPCVMDNSVYSPVPCPRPVSVSSESHVIDNSNFMYNQCHQPDWSFSYSGLSNSSKDSGIMLPPHSPTEHSDTSEGYTFEIY